MFERNTIAATAAVLLLTACGGGERAIIGIGNSGNRQGQASEIAEDLGEGLAETQAIPTVSDETLREIYEALLDKARTGDAEAALTIVELAVVQREE